MPWLCCTPPGACPSRQVGRGEGP
ncbi:hypothetical protein E0686_06665 [Deinococcus sp. S9]|nr:hypothetical protein E0686_06665 [Deinococcus sp. S9]